MCFVQILLQVPPRSKIHPLDISAIKNVYERVYLMTALEEEEKRRLEEEEGN